MNLIYSEAEIQALITLLELVEPIETPNNNFYPIFPQSLTAAQTYFRRFALDPAPAFEMLAAKGLVDHATGSWLLTPTGRDLAVEIRRLRPPIYYWYKDFYQAIAHSPAFVKYSWRVFGLDLGQPGFSDMTQLYLLLEVFALDPPARVLDIGCGVTGSCCVCLLSGIRVEWALHMSIALLRPLAVVSRSPTG